MTERKEDTMNDKTINVSPEEMQKLLAERCPGMSAATRSAVLQGAVLELKDGSTYQIPNAVRDGKPTHHARLNTQKVGNEWNH